MFSLKSFHLFFISLSIILTSGLGMWGILNHNVRLGASSLGIAVILVVYGGYFVGKAKSIHLD